MDEVAPHPCGTTPLWHHTHVTPHHHYPCITAPHHMHMHTTDSTLLAAKQKQQRKAAAAYSIITSFGTGTYCSGLHYDPAGSIFTVAIGEVTLGHKGFVLNPADQPEGMHHSTQILMDEPVAQYRSDCLEVLDTDISWQKLGSGAHPHTAPHSTNCYHTPKARSSL